MNKKEAFLRVLKAVNDSAQILIEKQIATAKDIDMAMVLGTGWPAYLAGPVQAFKELGQKE